MAEETISNQEIAAQPAEAGSNASEEVLDWEKKYHEEVKQSKSYRSRAQDAETNLDKYNKKQEATRKKKLEDEGKLQQIIDEQDVLITNLKEKAEYGVQLEKTQKLELLEQLSEDDRTDFEDLPLNQLRKIIPKLLSARAVTPEIPSIKGSLNTLSLDKPWKDMNEVERRAFYTQKANEQANN